MDDEVKDLFEILCEDDSYDDFLLAGANLYGGF